MSTTDSVAVPAPSAPDDSVSLDSALVDSVRDEAIALACPYCAAPMDPPSFRAWPLEPRLITGHCSGCGRDVTLPSQWLSTPPLQRG